ncbi:hypothetical protein F6X86_06695 [Enterococcus durans]|uniref:Phi-29-like late activator n=1 Tax=Enterococcus durans TaxID=53345 RepID=A0A5N0YRV9_9ENTE|nr:MULTISPECIES: hypothetical protein [Enterococcus]KAA9178921.1 hypothetical protein F6X86_06695 [Enterococcus durans]KAA9182323.1 hypothetical protein F6X85_13780 [Enterococcus durans]KAA9186664.1 hypothetical protein F6X90_06670 [Enterococcus durans]KAA9191469.1 hypothetical protein F6Y12_06555 [Enterococcus durans]KAA9193538.1 hypothetical protein F6X88_06710 [Enterococcus durans]
MVTREAIRQVTKRCTMEHEELVNTIELLKSTKKNIQELAENGLLTIPKIETTSKKCWEEIEKRNKEYQRLRTLHVVYEAEGIMPDKDHWYKYLEKKKVFSRISADFQDFIERFKDYIPEKSTELQRKVREILAIKGYIADSCFEGDYETWIGVYARPKDKPTYLDPRDDEEAALQEKYSVNGFKQDFSEWFEWEIKDNEIAV